MARALHLAARGLYTTRPNPRVGCVIAAGEKVLGEGWHHRAGGPHAEVEALRAAGAAARGATAYVTLEPCCHSGRTPPCTDALAAAGVARVVYAMADPNPRVAGRGGAQLAQAGIEVEAGLMAGAAGDLNAGFVARMTRGRPLVRSKIAASLDGRTALAGGESQWITGEAARADVQRLRARSCAILTGSGTLRADDPSLNLRAPSLDGVPQPLRVVLDSGLSLPADARLLSLPGTTLVYTVADPGSRPDLAVQAVDGAAVEVQRVATADGRVSLDAVLEDLARRGINEVLVEAGPALNGALLAGGHLDELVVYLAGCVLGDSARGMFALPPLTGMEARPAFTLAQTRRVGDDLRLDYRPAGE